ncbi:MAG: DEAD/DEAH box helicase [Spirosoma sp.]|nr:DEAD/DEAH box helicase [Spirosoma sp.]
MQFSDLSLIEPIQKALAEEGYTIPTPIQQQAIPILLARRDLLGCAQTGTGKTAAFAIPILQLLNEERQKNPGGPRRIKTLILTPTRELAIQIDESFGAYGRHLNLRHAVIFGGVSQHSQVNTLRAGLDILIATPGRLLDLMQQGHVNLRDIQFFVLDEADRMLDMGFIHDVRKVITKLPPNRQSLFFSATMPPDVAILADTILNNPAKVEVTPASSTADTIDQALYFVGKDDKRELLAHILSDKNVKSALVFARTKHGADKVVKDLVKSGFKAEAIHGNKSQNARQRALSNFKSGETRVLVATDIAARGIDVEELSHVINYELPNIPETYVHRIGRTGRAGHDGIALSFCEQEETEYLRDIQKLIGKKVPVVTNHPFPPNFDTTKVTPAPPQRQGRSGGGNREGQGRRPQGNSSRTNTAPATNDRNRSNERRPNAPVSSSPRRDDNRSQPRSGGNSSPQPRQADTRHAESTAPRSDRPERERQPRGTGNSRYLDFGSEKNY